MLNTECSTSKARNIPLFTVLYKRVHVIAHVEMRYERVHDDVTGYTMTQYMKCALTDHAEECHGSRYKRTLCIHKRCLNVYVGNSAIIHVGSLRPCLRGLEIRAETITI